MKLTIGKPLHSLTTLNLLEPSSYVGADSHGNPEEIL